MRIDELCVATMMFAREAQEERLLAGALQSLSRLGLPIVVTDGGSPDRLVEFVAALPNVRMTPAGSRGLVPQIKASFRAAHAIGRKFVLYTEPDKRHFFDAHLPRVLAEVPAADELGVAIATRTERSFNTFPPMQRFTEATINHLLGRRLGQRGDYSFGPFVINRELLPAVVALPDSLGWGWRHAAFALARRHGFQVQLVAGEFDCPDGQREESASEQAHRVRQLIENLQGLLAANAPVGSPQPRA